MPRFIFTHDGIAINVDHIVTIFLADSRHPEGCVVRCRTSLSGGEFISEHQVLNLSPVLADRETAQMWLNTCVKDHAADPSLPC